MSSSTSTPDEAAFLEWFTSKGGSVHPAVGFKQWEGQGRGCVALQDIEVSPVLPSSMMYEYLRTSTWKPYFSLLPNKFDSLMFWSDEELAELEGSTVLGKIGRGEADEIYAETVKPLVEKHAAVFGDAKDYSAELFHRMGSLARLFYEPTTLNMMSTSHIPAGAQIYNTYADPPNSDLLRRYGHVDEVNNADLVEIGLETVVDLVGEGVGMNEEKREARAEWLLEMSIDDTFSVETDLKVPDELVSAIRAFLLTPEEYAKAQKKESPPKPKLDAESAKWARKALEHRLGEYKTSIADDEALLQDSTLPLRRRMAIIVRLGEKRILQGAKAKLDTDFPEGQAEAPAKDKKRAREGKAGKEEGRKKKSKQ
ncbi:SET-domain protein [Rhodotorula sp. JG-1b]|nr:SET-domain protein [Rhodotorula sp. JG-1b]